jgi:hypothetical protein
VFVPEISFLENQRTLGLYAGFPGNDAL